MAVPRPVLLAVLGLALIAAAFLATRGASNQGTSVTPAPAVAPSAPHPPVHVAAKPAAPVAKPAPKQPASAAKPVVAPRATAPNQPLAPVRDALDRAGVVVLFFSKPGSADDDAARAAVLSATKASKNVSTFTVGLADVKTYRPLLTDVGVSQTPSVVVIGKTHKARLIEGFVDAGTLRQTILDARG